MDEAFETVVAENRLLRKEVKGLRERVTAVESSRWWRLHPRFALKRRPVPAPSSGQTDDAGSETARRSKLASVARQWTLKLNYQRLNRDVDSDEIVLRDGIRLKVHPDARSSFEQFCYWTPQMVDELDVFIANTSQRRRLLDVGAFQGLFSLVFAAHDPAKEALAVDASPIAFAKLLYNIHKNRAENIKAVECALSSAGGFLEMHYDWEQAVAGTNGGSGPPLRIESRTGDSLCVEHSFAPDTIKLDVEGHEARVLQGLRKTIAHNRPLIFLELHPATIAANAGNGTMADLVSTLVDLGYSNAELGERLVPVAALSEFTQIERCLLRPNTR